MPGTRKQKLELTWIGKGYRPKLEPRILLEEPEQSYHALHRITDHDIFDNRLIFGDNLLALKALDRSSLEQSNVSTSIRLITPERLLHTTTMGLSIRYGYRSCVNV